MANKFRETPVEEKPKAKKVPADNGNLGSTVNTGVPEDSGKQRDSMKNVNSVKTAKTEVPKEPVLGKKGKAFSRVLGGEVLADKAVTRQIWLVLLILGCFLVVVANRYNVEKVIRDKNATEENVGRLRERRIEMQKQYQQGVKISRIAEVLQESGVGITAGPPYVIEK